MNLIVRSFFVLALFAAAVVMPASASTPTFERSVIAPNTSMAAPDGASLCQPMTQSESCATARSGGYQVAECYCRTFKKVCVGWVRDICTQWLDQCISQYCD